MKIKKKQLIKLIREALEFPIKGGYAQQKKGIGSFAHPDFEKKDDVKQFMLKRMQDYGKQAAPDYEYQFGTGYEDYSTEEGLTLKDYRRYSKVLWNKFADHNFFKNNIAKLHQVGYAGGAQKMRRQGVSKKYLSGGKTELSVWGTKSSSPLKPSHDELSEVLSGGNPDQTINAGGIYLILDGRITWAGDFDAFTEELTTHRSAAGSASDLARQAAKKATSSSGMPKRPGGIRGLVGGAEDLKDYPIVLDEEDVDNMPDGRVEEMVVDNWKIKGIVNFYHVPALSIKTKSIDFIAKSLNRRRKSRKMMTDFHVLKRAHDDGYPNPMICDYAAGRYWTDQEVKQLFDLLDIGAY